MKNLFQKIKNNEEIRNGFSSLKTSIKNKIESKNLKHKFTNIKVVFQQLQTKLEQSIKSNENLPLLEQSRFWARNITWTLIGGSTFGVVWLTFAKTDEIVIAQGSLEPISGVVEVQMPLEGVARNVLVKEGEKVKKGDLLIRLDTDISQARIDSRKLSLEINNDILQRLALLVKEGAASELQYLQQQNKIAEIESTIKESEVILSYQEIIAPVDGKVFDLQPKGPGFVARTSEPVLKIVPFDKLQAKIEIPSQSIGFVTVGKETEISIDSFPATDFGVVNGKLKSIGSDALEPDPSQGKGYRFPAVVSLSEQKLKAKNGQDLNLQAGMSLTANIKLRKVTYLQLLLGTFTDKANSLRQL